MLNLVLTLKIGKEAEHSLEFQRMINDSTKRQFEGVLVYQLNHFARNRYD